MKKEEPIRLKSMYAFEKGRIFNIFSAETVCYCTKEESKERLITLYKLFPLPQRLNPPTK